MTAATSSAFFQTASPLPKEVFLGAYKDSILLSQLLFAPFGVDADATMRVFGEGIQAQEHTSSVFLLFEDIIAKRLFKLRGFEDDMIVASMHKYISENQDEEIVAQLNMVSQTLKDMYSPPTVMEFSFPLSKRRSTCCDIIDTVSAHTTSLLVDQVIRALKLVLYGDGYRVADGEVYLPTTVKVQQQEHHLRTSVDPDDDDDDDDDEGCRQSLFVRDEAVWSAVGVSIPLTQFNPISHFSRPPFQSISLQSQESIQLLLSSLTLPLQKLRVVVDVDDDDAHAEYASSSADTRRGGSGRCNDDGDERSISFSLVQYHTLLDIFGNDPLVRAVIARHAKECVVGDDRQSSTSSSLLEDGDGLEDGDRDGLEQYSIDSVRSGKVLYSLNLSTPPLVAYASQLRNMMMSNNSSDGDDDDDDDDRYVAMDDSELGLHLVMTAITNQKESKSAMIIGDSGAAIELLTDDVLEYFDDDCNDDDDSEDDEEHGRLTHVERIKSLVPTHLKVALLTERASCYLEAGQLVPALRDCDRAIQLDSKCARGYSLRSRIRSSMVRELDEGDDGDGDGDDDGDAPESRQGRRMEMLNRVAEDALLAFLLDGSSDISLASAAEEAAREACRWTAKDIFHARRREGLGGGGGGEHHDRVVDNRDGEERLTSKSTGDDSGVDGGDDGGDDKSPAKKIDKFPRSWLVASYFCGYEQLSIALSVYESNKFLSKNILQEASDTMTTSTTTVAVDHHHDHDDDGTATGADIDESSGIEPLFLAPPVYLLNPRNSNSDSNRSSCCRLDSEAYTLLVCLVELMEHVTYDEQSDEASINAQDNAADSTDAMKAVVMDMERHHRRHSPSSIGNRPDHGGGDDDTVSNGRSDGGTQTNGDDMRLFEITGTDTPVDHSTSSSVSFIELISGFTGIDGDDLDYHHHHHCMSNDIVLEGQCRVDQHIANTHTPPSQDYIDATVTGRTVPPCASFYRAFSLLYREDRSITGDSSAAAADDDDGGGAINSFSDTSTKVSATPVYLDELLSSVGALTSDCIHRLTGVVFAADGSIASVLDYPVPPPSSPSKMVVATNALDGRECSSGEAVDEEDNSNDRIDQDDDCWETVSNAGDDDDDDDDDGRIGDDVSRSIANEVSIALEQIRIEIDNAKIRYKEVECPSEVIEPTTQAAAEAEAPLIPSDHDNNEDGVRNNSCHDEVTDCSSSSCPLTLDVSHRLRARLLNICGSVAFLLGDAVGAVKCFRASIQQDDQLLDSQVKLGSLLVDMDELDEASELLMKVSKVDDNNAHALLHLAELASHKSSFEEAIKHLRLAHKISNKSVASGSGYDAAAVAIRHAHAEKRWKVLGHRSNHATAAITTIRATGAATMDPIEQYVRRMGRAVSETAANIHSLMGISQFRSNPSQPEIALYLLRSATELHPDSYLLLLCCGDVFNQMGDVVGALDCYQRASILSPSNPLCYINAARSYQLLNQLRTSGIHLQAALAMDPSLAMVRVDLSQNLLLAGNAKQALVLLDEALRLSKQVSEIRDVLTARTIALMQLDFERSGLVPQNPTNNRVD